MRTAISALSILFFFYNTAHAQHGQHPAKPPRIVAEAIGSLDNAGYTVARSINNRGQVVGYARNAAGDQVAFIWTRRQGFRQIADHSIAWDINDRGEVVGSTTICFDPDEEECQTTGFIWSRHDGLRDLGSFIPFSINDRGDMAGYCDVSHVFHACVMQSNAVVAGPENVQLYAINNRGDAAGGDFGQSDAVLRRRDGSFVDLGTGAAWAINNRGAVAGWRFDGTHDIATLWTKSGAVSPAISGSSMATGINSRSDVVGVDERGAFLWNPKTGVVVQLVVQPDQFTSATAINDEGTIVGYATVNGVVEMVLWHVRHGMGESHDARDK